VSVPDEGSEEAAQAAFGTMQTTGRAERYGERLRGVVFQFPDFEKVQLPDLLMPLRHGRSEHLEATRAAYVAWIVSAKLVEPGTRGYDALLGMKLDDCAAMIYPQHGQKMVLYGAVSLALFFVLDDFMDAVDADVDRKLAYAARLGKIAEGEAPVPGDDDLLRAWHRWYQEVASYASKPLFAVFATDLQRYVRALKAQTLRDQSAVVCLTTHLTRRRDNIASAYFMSIAAVFLEHDRGIDAREVMAEQHVKNIAEIVALVLVIHNELLGLYKDVKSGEANFITILQREHGLGLQAACDLAGKIADDMVKSMIQMEQDLPHLIEDYPAKAEAITRYLHTGYSLIRGTIDWYMISNRYCDERYFSA
jgi:Terpene synthase family 2, C-terminal metal binding